MKFRFVAFCLVLALVGCGGGGGGSDSGSNPVGANSTPVANAGVDQNATTSSTVILDGTNSSDADGDFLTYFWTFSSFPSGSSANLSDPSAVRPTFSADVNGNYVLNLIVNDGLENSAADSITVTAATANSAPVANAGSDQIVATGVTATLDGSNSTDADGDILTYSWTFSSRPSGSAAVLSDTSAVRPTFSADVSGSYILDLIVNDGLENSTVGTVFINAVVGGSAPVANAGPDQNVATGVTATLDASNSTDADGDILTYSWTFSFRPSGSAAILSDTSAVRPTFSTDVDGNYVFHLIVNDSTYNSNIESVTITAATGASAPVANAGSDQNVATGVTVTLDGSNSSDANGDTLTYLWGVTSRPVGSAAILSDTSAVRPTFSADVNGNYVLNLIVNDGLDNSTADSVTITAATASTPVANAGPDQNVSTGTMVTLDGTASSDADGDILTYSWKFSSRVGASGAVLSDTSVARPTFTADVDGNYVLNLIVNDGQKDSVADSVTITAATANSSPVANAGLDQNVFTIAAVTLDGTNSSDADGDILTYLWAFTSRPSGSNASLSDSGAVNPIFTVVVAGSYVLNLTVNDDQENSIVDSVTITAVSTETRNLTLPDTGQTTCYNTLGTVVSCSNTSQDGELSINSMSFTDNGNGTISDNVTGLIWQMNDDDTLRTWDDAASYCSGLTLTGSSAWRLPTRRELISIVDYGAYDPSINIVLQSQINSSYFPGTNSAYYWTSTDSVVASAWVVSFKFTVGGAYGDLKTGTHYVRCVQ